jgi:signal transduction histidine kinase
VTSVTDDSTRPGTRPGGTRPQLPLLARVKAGVLAVAHGVGLAALAMAGPVLLAALLLSVGGPVFGFAFAVLGPSWELLYVRPVLAFSMLLVLFLLVPLLVTGILTLIRHLATLTRRLCGEWCGVSIADPYRPRPAASGQTRARILLSRRMAWILADPASWRDLSWVVVNSFVGWILTAAPVGLVLLGLLSILRGNGGPAVTGGPFADGGMAKLILGVLLLATGVLTAPALLRWHGLMAKSMLAPSGSAELEQRVRHLSQTRTETIDTGAAEIRRIERDLHDGAQARLVAMGMTLDAAGHLIDDDPKAARALLIEARDNSAKALADLRDLVRGIHPPVLADRGLADAIRALALDSPLRTHVVGNLEDRAPAPVESATYFAVSELLANVQKHAHAHQAWVDIRQSDQMLRIGVTDDGQGGADPRKGTGLRGIERRIAAFDGVLAVSSPPGGPTAVTMEIPCVLSSQKTSFS